MSRSGKFVVLVSVVWCIGSVAVFTRRTPFLQLLSLPLALLFFAAIGTSLVCVFAGWRQCRWRSVLPLASCVIAVFLSGMLVRTARHFVFVWALPSYEAVVHQMESGSILVTTNFDNIPQAESEARLVYRVFAQRETNGVLMVEFDMESGFPVKHSGYLYSSSGVIEPGSRMDSRWPIRQEVRSRWFYISD
jgi:NADH:ubiquinone oxidoreductase subunit K